MVLEKGEKVHIITRRRFADDIRRHFAGIITQIDGNLVRLEGYVFVFNPGTNDYIRLNDKRTRILSLADSGHIINVIAEDIELDRLEYKEDNDGRLIVTDNVNFELEINEFGYKT